ncbi:MAG TPA: GAF domain-containing sensor histidine kinase, partial [Anaerolineaceae bacterium]|nr:GAF domain-containing sensor histidine kinase [Anaerolineaceae bacterium]
EITLQRSLHRYQQLIEIARDLASTLDLGSLLQRIVHASVEITGAEEASILLYDEKREALYFQTVTDPKMEPLLKGIVVPTDSIAGWVALNNQAVIVPDAHKDTRFFGKVEEESHIQTRSIIAVPMLVREKLVGVLEVLNKHEGTFNEEDVVTLQVLSAQAAVAIENARLFHQSDLISELVHELRTPLGSIATITYMLQRPEISEEQRQSMIQTVRQETQRLTELTTSYLDLARLESGRTDFHLASFDLHTLGTECAVIIQSRAAESGVQLNLEIPQSFQITADRSKIKQVLLNLLSNAVKYNHPGGNITLRAWEEADSHLFSVTDTGHGMDSETLSHLFEKFYRARQISNISGTGLGLSICKRIIEGHHGSISVQSTPGFGSTFTVQLPRG